MKTKTYHVSNLGSFGGVVSPDANGYVTYHDSPRYAKATSEQLADWSESPTRAVRNAAKTELAERGIQHWRSANG